jgi:hypothetical protein
VLNAKHGKWHLVLNQAHTISIHWGSAGTSTSTSTISSNARILPVVVLALTWALLDGEKFFIRGPHPCFRGGRCNRPKLATKLQDIIMYLLLVSPRRHNKFFFVFSVQFNFWKLSDIRYFIFGFPSFQLGTRIRNTPDPRPWSPRPLLSGAGLYSQNTTAGGACQGPLSSGRTSWHYPKPVVV